MVNLTTRIEYYRNTVGGGRVRRETTGRAGNCKWVQENGMGEKRILGKWDNLVKTLLLQLLSFPLSDIYLHFQTLNFFTSIQALFLISYLQVLNLEDAQVFCMMVILKVSS